MKIVSQISVGLAVVPLTLWMGVVVLALLRGEATRCPKCRSRRIRRSWPRFKDRFLPLFVLARRCEVCRRRFYAVQSIDYTGRTPMRSEEAQVRP
ncbi:MAG: hypothetical protein ABSB35_27165 [Bryobacteraceae bacterium]|jgi:hypothetical protein